MRNMGWERCILWTTLGFLMRRDYLLTEQTVHIMWQEESGCRPVANDTPLVKTEAKPSSLFWKPPALSRKPLNPATHLSWAHQEEAPFWHHTGVDSGMLPRTWLGACSSMCSAGSRSQQYQQCLEFRANPLVPLPPPLSFQLRLWGQTAVSQ